MYTGFKRSKLITHAGHNRPTRALQRTQPAIQRMLERRKNAVRDDGAAVVNNAALEGNGVNGEDVAPRGQGRKASDNIGHKR